MQTSAVLRGVRLSEQKGRLVADQVRGLPVNRALNLLAFSPKKGAVIIRKLLESAIANAEHNDGASRCVANMGWKPGIRNRRRSIRWRVRLATAKHDSPSPSRRSVPFS